MSRAAVGRVLAHVEAERVFWLTQRGNVGLSAMAEGRLAALTDIVDTITKESHAGDVD